MLLPNGETVPLHFRGAGLKAAALQYKYGKAHLSSSSKVTTQRKPGGGDKGFAGPKLGLRKRYARRVHASQVLLSCEPAGLDIWSM